ncbi:MAG: DNA recombination protein RmuC [Steroidobacteraceae bacterium]
MKPSAHCADTSRTSVSDRHSWRARAQPGDSAATPRGPRPVGEITLRRVVELAGMSQHCDFSEQQHVDGAERVQRPDLVVHLPDQRDLVIDAKTPLDAYLEAIDADEEPARRAALVRHARQVEARVRDLANKSYWSQFDRSPEFAILFCPATSSCPPHSPRIRSWSIRP